MEINIYLTNLHLTTIAWKGFTNVRRALLMLVFCYSINIRFNSNEMLIKYVLNTVFTTTNITIFTIITDTTTINHTHTIKLTHTITHTHAHARAHLLIESMNFEVQRVRALLADDVTPEVAVHGTHSHVVTVGEQKSGFGVELEVGEGVTW